MKPKASILLAALALVWVGLGGGCINVHVDPIEATVNLNIIQKSVSSDLDSLYSGDVGVPPKPPATAPATAGA